MVTLKMKVSSVLDQSVKTVFDAKCEYFVLYSFYSLVSNSISVLNYSFKCSKKLGAQNPSRHEQI